MTRPRRWVDGEVMAHDTDDGDMTIRGHISDDDLPEIVNSYDTDMTSDGRGLHTWARSGFTTDDDGNVCTGGIYTGLRFAGKRGSFAVTVVSVREVSDV